MTWSNSGSLAHAVDDAAADTPLLWLTRQGKTEPTAFPARQHYPSTQSLALSPDRTRVAVRILAASRSQSDLWVGDIARGTFTRLTSTGTATDPVWTPDGTRVCYTNNAIDLHCQPFDGSAPSERLFQLDHLSTIAAISPDGAWFLLSVNQQRGGFDIWLAPNRPPFEARPLLATPANESTPAVSPDGKWIAFGSEESGREEIYVRPFPDIGKGRWQVSTAGGSAPRWSRDGRELYYLASGTAGTALRVTLTAVRVNPGTSSSTSIKTGPAVDIATLPSGLRGYDVAPDGRFLISSPVTSSATGTRQRIVVVQNGLDPLRGRLAAATALH